MRVFPPDETADIAVVAKYEDSLAITGALDTLNLSARIYDTAEGFLEGYDKAPTRFRLVITRAVMGRYPSMDGRELVRQIRQKEKGAANAPGANTSHRRLYCVLFSLINGALEAREVDADAFINVPFYYDDLVALIRQGLEQNQE